MNPRIPAAPSRRQPKVVISHWVHPEVIARLETACRVMANPSRRTLPREEILARCRDAAGLLAFMPDHIDAAFLEQCPQLRVIGAALKGYDNFDVAACSARGVWLSIVPDLLTAPTAELAVTLLLGLIRKLRGGDEYVRSGFFEGWQPLFYGAGLTGSRIGLLGMGAVGRAIARRLAGFEAQLCYFDPRRLSPEEERNLTLAYLPQAELLGTCDHLLCSVPLTAQTQHLLDTEALRQLKPGAFLVNIGRGSVIDEQAVAAALKEGRLAGYAADVFAFEDWALAERPRAIPPALLAETERTLFTPHLGSAVDAVRLEVALFAAEAILAALRGEVPPGTVNQPSPPNRPSPQKA